MSLISTVCEEKEGIVPKRARQSWVGWVQPTGHKPMFVGGLHPPYEKMGRCRKEPRGHAPKHLMQTA